MLSLDVGDRADAWADAGFTVTVAADGTDEVRIGDVALRLLGPAGDRRGILAWTLAAIGGDGRHDLDGLPTTFVRPAPAALDAGTPTNPTDPTVPAGTGGDAAPAHPNGIVAVDHVVVATPDLERTVLAISALGVPCRRIRDATTGDRPLRQGFFKFGPVTIEVVSDDRGAGLDATEAPATWFGLAFDATDLAVTRAALGPDGCSEARPAVQAGRRIATLRHRRFDISVPLAALDHRPDP